ncbi:M3 family metallopeptidase [Psychromicrobium xiongbiense]|uniref:M3 family metallopeptidase n=1 Tax=Psychromicrobium xiongbiense TaxID=3051184 RepID=UPI0025572103|nr:M3 family metallopeptidase [Psychromicrobium sp. YIM S02556]
MSRFPSGGPANPLLVESTLPYRLPDFAQIRPEHYLPAFAAACEDHLSRVAAIRDNPQPPTFLNTAEAMERAGTLLRQVSLIFYNMSASNATAEIQQIEQVVAPLLSQHEDAIWLDAQLYARFSALPLDGLDPEQQRLVTEYLADFRRRGATLDEPAKVRLRALNTDIAELSTRYSQDGLAALNEAAVLVDDVEELAGLTPSQISAARAAAESADHPEKYLLTLIQPSGQPVLESLHHRPLRQRVSEASVSRGLGTGTSTARLLAMLRAERAALLGYAHHAELATESQTAPSTSAIQELLARLTPAAVRNAQAESELLSQAAGHALQPWDWAYYSEKVRTSRFDVDLAALTPYFELNRVLEDGVFYAAAQLYGLSFIERTDLVGYHPGVRIWEVRNADGSGLGLFLGDYFTRDTKSGGAWMNPLVEQSGLLGHQSVVVNNLNIPAPADGEPALLSYDEVVTCFHEFGHALHGLFSQVHYPRFSGTEVPRDFVEYPSQVNEMWVLSPDILANYARHHETGEPIPAEWIERLLKAQSWGEGFRTTEYLGAALLDQAWHHLRAGEDPGDPEEFEAAALRAADVFLDLIPPRYRTGYFKHIFSDGYSAGYYSYIWSEVLDADTVQWFAENGGLSRENGDHFRRTLLATGNSIDPLQAFRNFRGRDAAIEPLLRRRGLTD